MAYGYNLRMTPLQILAFYNALANDGVMVKPHFVDRIISDNRLIHEYGTEVLNPKIMSEASLNELRDILKNIVKRGTGKALSSPYFSIAGKTGTARTEYWMEDWDEDRRYISSFAGYFPADQPKYSCIVVIHKPSTKKGYYGADVTGPVFKRIAQKIYTDSPVKEHIILPTGSDPELAASESNFNALMAQNTEEIPDLTGWPLMDAVALLENMGVSVSVRGSGPIIRQIPEAGAALRQTTTITLIGS